VEGSGSSVGPSGFFGGAGVEQEGSEVAMPAGTFFATGGPPAVRAQAAAGGACARSLGSVRSTLCVFARVVSVVSRGACECWLPEVCVSLVCPHARLVCEPALVVRWDRVHALCVRARGCMLAPVGLCGCTWACVCVCVLCMLVRGCATVISCGPVAMESRSPTARPAVCMCACVLAGAGGGAGRAGGRASSSIPAGDAFNWEADAAAFNRRCVALLSLTDH
jgi:hypothetical protein